MDTTTVLEIIKMLDVSINHHHTEIEKEDASCEGRIGAHDALSEFRDHLQSYIEAQVNAIENQGSE